MKKSKTAICMIHGKYYSGWCECPICKEQKEIEKKHCSYCMFRTIIGECPNCGQKT